VSFDQIIEIKTTRTSIKRCPDCLGRLIKFGGYEYQDKHGQSFSFTVGRVCKTCHILYINPRFKNFKVIFHKIGGNNEKKDL